MSLFRKVDGKIRTLLRWRRGRPLEGPQVDNTLEAPEDIVAFLGPQVDNTLEAPEDIVAFLATCSSTGANRNQGAQHLAELGRLMEIYLDVSSTHAPTSDEGGSNYATSLNMESFLSSCSEDDGDCDSNTTSVVSVESGWKSCSTACSMSSNGPDAPWDWQTHTRRGYAVTTQDTAYPSLRPQEPYRTAYSVSREYQQQQQQQQQIQQQQQFATDRLSINADQVEEGWNGMVVWPRRMDRIAEQRLPRGRPRPLQGPQREQQPRPVRRILSL